MKSLFNFVNKCPPKNIFQRNLSILWLPLQIGDISFDNADYLSRFPCINWCLNTYTEICNKCVHTKCRRRTITNDCLLHESGTVAAMENVLPVCALFKLINWSIAKLHCAHSYFITNELFNTQLLCSGCNIIDIGIRTQVQKSCVSH